MKNHKVLFRIIVVVFIIGLMSCTHDDTDNNIEPDFTAGSGPSKNFFVYNENNEINIVSAKMASSNNHVEIWVQERSGVTKFQVNGMAAAYSNIIRPRLMNRYGWKGEGRDTLQWANWLVNGNGKVVILLSQMAEGFGGYFHPADLLDDDVSNKLAIIHVTQYIPIMQN